mmetsp:Transcript_13371/g.47956  ORF Transcript_13371/g.47956 Transcript_13371/m.47956 type:complete len:237 (-) Transcript_13371:481-1191(-)
MQDHDGGPPVELRAGLWQGGGVQTPGRDGRAPGRRSRRRLARVAKLRLASREAHVQGEKLPRRRAEDVPRVVRVSRPRRQDQHPVPPQRAPVRDVLVRGLRDGLHRLHPEPLRARRRQRRHDEAADVPRRGGGQRREAPGRRRARADRRRADAAGPVDAEPAEGIQADPGRGRPRGIREGCARPRGVAHHGHDVARRAPVLPRDADAHAGYTRRGAVHRGGARERVLAGDVGRRDV